MAWIVLLLIVALVLVLLVFFGKIPRKSWELTAAALFIGVAGYAWQGSPSLAGAPKEPVEKPGEVDEVLLEQRTTMGNDFTDAKAWLVLADSQSRQGKFATASAALNRGLEAHPDDPDLWLALGNALVGHSGGLLTPASQFAYQKAANIAPEHPGPPFFLGLALATSGQLEQARAIWADLLARSPADAEWRGDLEQRLAQVDALLAQQGQGLRPPAASGPPVGP